VKKQIIMTAEKFSAFLEDPKQVNKDNYADIQKLVEQFPYFQTAHVLLLIYANENDKKNFDKYAEKSAVFITDRTRLFELTRQIKTTNNSVKKPKERKSVTSQRTVNIPSKSEKQKLDEQLKQIEQAAKKETKQEDKTQDKQKREVKKDGENDKAKEINKKVVDKKADDSGEVLSDRGSKAHNALLDDLFKEKVHKREDEEQQKQKEHQADTTAKKTNEVSSEELTNDIYNKIAGLKRDKLKVKNISSQKDENKFKTETEQKKAPDTRTEEVKNKEPQKENTETKSKPITEEQKNETNKEEVSKKPERKTPGEEKSAAEKLNARIQKVKNGIHSEDKKTSDTQKTEEQQAEKSNTTDKNSSAEKNATTEENKSDKNDDVFEMTNTRTEKVQTNKSDNKEKTAADTILERINRLKGEKDEKKDKLIEEFVKKEPRMERTKDKIPEIEGDVAEESTKEKEPVVTELMANIYINQGYYDKAIEVFKKLILKNPKKKDYFAAKIQETEEMK
jgi:hypothetical protein